MKVLFVTPEMTPLVKTGGLADVGGALPKALSGLGVDCRLLMPGYPAVLSALASPSVVQPFDGDRYFPPFRLVAGEAAGLRLFAIDCPSLYDRGGDPYRDPSGSDWGDNPFRFGLLSRVAARMGQGEHPGWAPDVLHLNDWQSGLVPAYLRFDSRPAAATLMSIHNLAYTGSFDPSLVAALGLPPAAYAMEGVEFYGAFSFLKAGLYYADRLATVSPTYAEEIRTPAFGCGFEGLLETRRGDLTGILNGIDTEEWNPASDPHLVRRYGPETLADKGANRAALRAEMGLDPDETAPLFGIISRLAYQKGLDLVLGALDGLVGLPAQLAVLGNGESAIEDGFHAAAARFPGRVGFRAGFDLALAHRIEAGADFFLMPSRYEPCGLNQMYSQRYGTPPVVHATGGLVDSVADSTEENLAKGTASGFLFGTLDLTGLSRSLAAAHRAYHDPATYRALQIAGMRRDFSWAASAARYAALYQDLVGARR